ncbi:MAG: cell division protein FtsZ [Flavobacteriia bacterium]|nr:cell division protein FtsZ [Flavobacteriia bacterium]
MEFDMPKEISSIIKVFGVGGGGGNAVGHMYRQGVKGVDFVICNTDKQHLDKSPVSFKIQLGPSLTEGLGAGSFPETGKNAAVESIEEIRSYLEKGTKMVFITAGMGGGTGTGAAPVIAQLAKEMGILTVGIVTSPFLFEGKTKLKNAEAGIEELRKHVDSLLVINNERLFELENKITMNNAYAQADNVLCIAARGIADVISETGIVNVDFNDVKTVMKNSGVALMGTASADGENRAMECVQAALTSPLLNDNIVYGAKHIILNISYGEEEITLQEMNEITNYIRQEAGEDADLFFGHVHNPELGNKISITFIATGFNKNNGSLEKKDENLLINHLDDESKSEVKAPLQSPFDTYSNSHKESEVEQTIDEPFLKQNEEVFNEIPHLMEEDFILENEENSVEFELKPSNEPVTLFEEHILEEKEEKVVLYDLDQNIVSQKDSSEKNSSSVSAEEQQKLNQKRMNVFSNLASQLKKPDVLKEMESTPAWKRQNIDLDLSTPSKEPSASKYQISVDENGKSGIKGNNSFLHGNVD